MPYGSKLHIPPTNYHLLAAQQEPYKKAYPLTKNIWEFSGEKKVRRTEPLAEKWQDRKSKRTRQKKQERKSQNDSPVIPDRRGHQTSPASLRGYDALQYQAGLRKGWVVQKILSGHNDMPP